MAEGPLPNVLYRLYLCGGDVNLLVCANAYRVVFIFVGQPPCGNAYDSNGCRGEAHRQHGTADEGLEKRC